MKNYTNNSVVKSTNMFTINFSQSFFSELYICNCNNLIKYKIININNVKEIENFIALGFIVSIDNTLSKKQLIVPIKMTPNKTNDQ